MSTVSAMSPMPVSVVTPVPFALELAGWTQLLDEIRPEVLKAGRLHDALWRRHVGAGELVHQPLLLE
jgi:hypothetical protein